LSCLCCVSLFYLFSFCVQCSLWLWNIHYLFFRPFSLAFIGYLCYFSVYFLYFIYLIQQKVSGTT
jgi:hypothetical protein